MERSRADGSMGSGSGSWAAVAVVVLAVVGAAGAVGLAPPPSHVGYSQFLLFPQKGSGMGIFLALSVPLDSLHHDVSLAYNFEANYVLPTNATELTDLQAQYGYRRSQRSAAAADGAAEPQHEAEPESEPERAARSLRDVGRADFYAMFMGSIARAGLPGRECLLRAICEASEWPMTEGLLGNLLTVLLTPSSSNDDDLHPAFHAAERRGRRGADCAVHYRGCATSLLGLLTEQQE